MREILKFVCALLFSFHIAAITLAHLPVAYAPPRSMPALMALERYRRATYTWQHWTMFMTKPHFSEFEPLLRVRDKNGEWQELGAILPGFRPYQHAARHMLFFIYSLNNSGARLRYMEEVCRAGKGHPLGPFQRVRLKFAAAKTKPLGEIKAGGSIGVKTTYTYKDLDCRQH